MGAKYTLYPGNFRREILQADFMAAEMNRRAEAVKEVAEAIAPRDTGRYSRSFRIRNRKRGGIHGDRVSATVYSTDPAWLSIEFGRTNPDGSRVSGHYTLTTAMDSAGGHS